MSNTRFSNDQPLRIGSAFDNDKLDRQTFAESVALALRKVTKEAGFTLAIEGKWGSGKTSTLAMVEDVLRASEDRCPIIVHFNPWLIGDRDALLKQFLTRIASAIELSDIPSEVKKVAEELRTYSGIFGILKLIPGAAPWISIVKNVLSAIGKTIDDITENKIPDIEEQRDKVVKGLQKCTKPIVVFIDDIDRLSSQEALEMIRIIKAVGDFPNVGYVVAWDAEYVIEALKNALVPQPDVYLEKIVQVRMPLPVLSFHAREKLFNEAIEPFKKNAGNYFQDNEERLRLLLRNGLLELLNQPRDINRIFNTVCLIEPSLRGEIMLADIVGWATIIVKAQPVFELASKYPEYFVTDKEQEEDKNSVRRIMKRLPYIERRQYLANRKPPAGMPNNHAVSIDELRNAYGNPENKLENAYYQTGMYLSVKKLVRFFFPEILNIDVDAYPPHHDDRGENDCVYEDGLMYTRLESVIGKLADPKRFFVVRQLKLAPTDASMVKIARYLAHPDRREGIIQSLNEHNFEEFIETLGTMAQENRGQGISDLEQLCLSMGRLADCGRFSSFPKDQYEFSRMISRAIKKIIMAVNKRSESLVASKIVRDADSLSVAWIIIENSYSSESGHQNNDLLVADDNIRENLFKFFFKNQIDAAKRGAFEQSCRPAYILHCAADVAPKACPDIFDAFEKESFLDNFALQILRAPTMTGKSAYALTKKNKKTVEVYCSFDKFYKYAKYRQFMCGYPARAAWQSVVDAKPVYEDGSPADHDLPDDDDHVCVDIQN